MTTRKFKDKLIMATIGRKTNTSDETFDFLCCLCSKKGKNKEADKYCADCQEYLCENCVENHNSFSVLAGHKLVGRSQFGTTTGTDTKGLPSIPTERCKVHTLKLVDMYCVNHDSVGCHVCFTINHKPCGNIHYIPEYIQTTSQAEHTRKIQHEMKKAISTIEDLMKKKQKARNDNKKAKSSSIKEIKTFRADINQALDRLEQASLDILEEKYSKLDKTIQNELQQMQEALDKLARCKVAMESSRTNASQQFVSRNICEKVISETEENTASPIDERRDRFTFTGNSELLSLFQNLKSLGQEHSNLYEVVSKKSFSVKLASDKNNCDIWSSCILDSGDILLADYNNNNIKLFEGKTYTVRESMQMPASPRSICRVSSTEAAVSLYKSTVQFVSTENGLSPTRVLKFDHECRGIAVVDSQIVVCEHVPRGYIYTMDGKRLKTFEKDSVGNVVFGFIREICVSDDGKRIHMTDINKSVLTIDKDGSVIWRCSGYVLKDAWGVCTDGRDNVFVSGNQSHNVLQIRSDGQYIGEVIPVSHGLKNPRAVCFDKKNSKLIVVSGNQLHVFLVR